MPKPPLIRTKHVPYHITARTNNRDWFDLPLERVWSIFCEKLQKVSELYGAQIHAFVLMSNHFHMLVSTPNANIDSIMQYLQREVAKTMGLISGRINHLFGARYHPSVIYDPFYLAHALKYLYRNPVEAGLCELVEDYPFSTVRAHLNQSLKGFPLQALDKEFARLIPTTNPEFYAWLNRRPHPRKTELIRLALRRKTFAFTKEHRFKRHVQELRTGVENEVEKVTNTFSTCVS